MVAGFHGLDLELGSTGEDRERGNLGTRELQKAGWATRGRWDSCASRVWSDVEKGRGCTWRLAQDAQMLWRGRTALEGAIVV